MSEEELGDSADLIEDSAEGFGGGSGIADRETSGTTASSETSESTGTTEATEASGEPEPGDPEFRLKEAWNGRTIYLSDEDVEALDRLYKRLDLEWSEDHGEDLPKNERFYPAVVRAALENPDLVAEELGVEPP